MDEEEAKARLRLIQIQKEKNALPAETPEQPQQASSETPDIETGSGPAHAAKGFGQLGFEFADLPHTLTTAVRGGLDKAAQMMGFEGAPNLTELTEPYIGEASKVFGLSPALAPPIYPKVSELPIAKDVYEAVGSPEPGMEGTGWDLARTGIVWGGGGPINAARKLATKPDVLMAGGAMAGQAAADYFGSDSTMGELVGGVTGLLGGLKRGKNVLADENALKFIRSHADDSDQAIKNIEDAIKRGEEGSLAQLSGDQGLYDIDAGVRIDAKTGNALAEKDILRQQQIAEQVRGPFGAESKVPAIEAAKASVAGRQSRIASGRNSIQEAIDDTYGALQEGVTGRSNAAARATSEADVVASAADEAATAAGLPLATSRRPAQTSAGIQETVQEGVKEYKANIEQPLWNEFKEIQNVDIKPIQKAANDA